MHTVLTSHRAGAIAGAAAAALALAAAGCGSSGPSSGPSSGGGHSSSRAAKNPEQAAYAYARCIRGHGVPSFPDPRVTTTPGGGMSMQQGVPASAGLSPAFKAAQRDCQHLQPGVGSGHVSSGPPKAALLAFARCLRAHGVPHFPDPNGQGQLTGQMLQASGVDLHAPGFLVAAKACVGVTHGAITGAQVEQAIKHVG